MTFGAIASTNAGIRVMYLVMCGANVSGIT